MRCRLEPTALPSRSRNVQLSLSFRAVLACRSEAPRTSENFFRPILSRFCSLEFGQLLKKEKFPCNSLAVPLISTDFLETSTNKTPRPELQQKEKVRSFSERCIFRESLCISWFSSIKEWICFTFPKAANFFHCFLSLMVMPIYFSASSKSAGVLESVRWLEAACFLFICVYI